MKNTIYLTVLIFGLGLGASSCSTYRSHGENSYQNPLTVTSSINEYDLEILPGTIEYTIDISTTDGAFKLRNLRSRSEAEAFVLREAIMANNCATIFNPQYNVLMQGRRILRVTVYGQPAVYKNQQK